MADHNSTHSVLRERIVEHVFVGEVLRYLWQQGITDVEVLRSEFDAHGYDIVLSSGPIVRHIQFKTKLQRENAKKKKPLRVSVSRSLAEKPSGCVIWILISDHLELGPFYWFGNSPGKPLPSLEGFRPSKHIRRTAEGERKLRKNHCTIPANQFEKIDTLEGILRKLFGDLIKMPTR